MKKLIIASILALSATGPVHAETDAETDAETIKYCTWTGLYAKAVAMDRDNGTTQYESYLVTQEVLDADLISHRKAADAIYIIDYVYDTPHYTPEFEGKAVEAACLEYDE